MLIPLSPKSERFLHLTPSKFFRQSRAAATCAAICRTGRIKSGQRISQRTPGDRNLSSYRDPPSKRHTPLLRLQCRAQGISSTASSSATTILQNPRMDEDGEEMTIEISDRAAKRLQQIMSAPPQSLTGQKAPAHNHLRVSVTSGGCHGFQYLMSLEPSVAIENEVDTIFAYQDPAGSAKVVMDEASLELLKGSTIDYVTELIGSQFKIVGNPRAKSSCGCGTSFDIED